MKKILSACFAYLILFNFASLSASKIFDLSYSRNSRFQGLIAKPLNPAQLTDEQLSHAISSEEGELYRRNIKSLDLSGCFGLRNVQVLVRFDDLQFLDISGCTGITALPNGWKNNSLLVLNANECTGLNDLSGLSDLTNLTECNISGARILDLPNLRHLTRLETFRLSQCEQLVDISCLSGLKDLVSLRISGCKGLVDGSALLELTSLKHLELVDCPGIVELHLFSRENGRGLTNLINLVVRGCTGLRVLDLFGCKNLSSLFGVSELKNLEMLDLSGGLKLCNLDISGCSRLIDLFGLDTLCELNSVNYNGCNSLSLRVVQFLDNFKNKIGGDSVFIITRGVGIDGNECLVARPANPSTLTDGQLKKALSAGGIFSKYKIEILDLSNCVKIGKSFPIILTRSVRYLKQVKFCNCAVIRDILWLSYASDLHSIDCSGCVELRKIYGLSGLKKLVNVDFRDCVKLKELDFSGCLSLRSLSGLVKVTSDGRPTGCINLWSLDLSDCKNIDDLRALCLFKDLRTLRLSGLNIQASDLHMLCELENLKVLSLSGCTSLQSTLGLPRFENLYFLDLSGCTRLTDLSGLSRLSSLRSISLSGCSSLTSCLDLSGFVNLHELYLAGCRFRRISGLSGLKVLRVLDLSGYSGPFSFQDLPNSLWNLYLRNINFVVLFSSSCMGSRSRMKCKLPEFLQVLNLSGSRGLPKLNVELSNLKRLRELILSSCFDIPKDFLRGLDKCENLTVLNLYNSSFCVETIDERLLHNTVCRKCKKGHIQNDAKCQACQNRRIAVKALLEALETKVSVTTQESVERAVSLGGDSSDSKGKQKMNQDEAEKFLAERTIAQREIDMKKIEEENDDDWSKTLDAFGLEYDDDRFGFLGSSSQTLQFNHPINHPRETICDGFGESFVDFVDKAEHDSESGEIEELEGRSDAYSNIGSNTGELYTQQNIEYEDELNEGGPSCEPAAKRARKE